MSSAAKSGKTKRRKRKNNMFFEIIDANEAHLPQILKIERECFSLPWTEEALGSQLDKSRHVFLSALWGGTVLGYVGLMFVLDEGYISNVAVSSEHRRKGVGEALVAALKERGEALGLSFMSLEVRASNAPAIALYEKLGFQHAGVRKGYYEKPREDALIMTYYFDRGQKR